MAVLLAVCVEPGPSSHTVPQVVPVELDGLTGTGECQNGHRRGDDGTCQCFCGYTDEDGWCVHTGCDDDDDDGGGGGGGGGGRGGGGGGGGVIEPPDTSRYCEDLRDTLAAEYVGKGILQAPGGEWDCHSFSESNGRFIVNGPGIEHGNKHGYYGYVDSDLTSGMAAVEAHFGKSFRINSGYRCPVGNGSAEVGGQSGSAHVRGRGVDFQLPSGDTIWTWEYKKKIIEWALDNTNANEGYRYANKSHVHLGFNVEK